MDSTGKKIRVILATDGIFPLSVGGMQRHSRLLAEALAATGQAELTVIHPHGDTRVFGGMAGIREVGVDMRHAGPAVARLFYGLKGFGYLIRARVYSREVFRILQSHPGAVVYSQGLSVWYGIDKLRQPVVVNPHGLEPYQGLSWRDKLTTWPLRRAHNTVLKHAHRVISLGGRLTRLLTRIAGDGKVVVIPNAVAAAPAPHHDFAAEPLRILFVGRFAHNKGLPYLMEAIRRLNAGPYGGRLQFHLVGTGPLFQSTRRECRDATVVFHGKADDDALAALYASSHLFVLPTLFEGMPTVVLEAMRAGLPVLVTDTGATRELVDDGNGILIAKKSASAIQAAVIRFYNLPVVQKEALSACGIARVNERFTWEAVAAKHVDLFRQLSRTDD